MRVDALEPGRRVAWTGLGDFPNWEGTVVAWELEPSGTGTGIMFRHGGWADDYPERDWASVNWVWGQVVARLKGFLESGEPQPFFG
jgi:Activator of Hsp90 ATPase homolog 1-like protein